MSDLVVVSFKGEETADQVLIKLQQMQKEHLIDLEDACIVVRSAKGKVHLKQAVDLVLPELKPFGGNLLKTSLTNDQEERLKKALEGLNSSGTAS